MKLIKLLMPLGMIGAVAYMLHALIGPALWREYNSMVTDLSTLTADNSPIAGQMRVFTYTNGICLVLFSLGVCARGRSEYHAATRAGYWIFLFMALVSTVGYAFYPLMGDKKVMIFQNRMHLVVTIVVMLSTLAALYVLSYGYFRKERRALPGWLSLMTALIMTVFGALSMVMMAGGSIFGLMQRISIYTLQGYVFMLSFLMTFEPERVGLELL